MLPTAPQGWVKCREHISLYTVYATNKAPLLYLNTFLEVPPSKEAKSNCSWAPVLLLNLHINIWAITVCKLTKYFPLTWISDIFNLFVNKWTRKMIFYERICFHRSALHQQQQQHKPSSHQSLSGRHNLERLGSNEASHSHMSKWLQTDWSRRVDWEHFPLHNDSRWDATRISMWRINKNKTKGKDNKTAQKKKEITNMR